MGPALAEPHRLQVVANNDSSNNKPGLKLCNWMDTVDTFLNGELQWQGSEGLEGELVPQDEVPVLVPAQEAAVLGQQPSQSVLGRC